MCVRRRDRSCCTPAPCRIRSVPLYVSTRERRAPIDAIPAKIVHSLLMLGGESPLDHMDTVTGMEEVKTMLYHIEYGMPA